MKKSIFLTLILIMTLVGGSISYAGPHPVGSIFVYVNNGSVNFTEIIGQPYLDNGKFMIPLRKVAETMNLKVNWDPLTNETIVSNSKTRVSLAIGRKDAIVNGVSKPIETPMVFKASVSYIPYSALELLGAEIEYYEVHGSHHIRFMYDEPVDTVIVGGIKPQIVVRQLDMQGSEVVYFKILLKNYKDFEGTDINITTELLSPERLRKTRHNSLFTEGEIVVGDNNRFYADMDYVRLRSNAGLLHRLFTLTYTIDLNEDKLVELPKEGELLKFKTTVTLNGETKEFFYDVPFLNKDFFVEEGKTRRSDR